MVFSDTKSDTSFDVNYFADKAEIMEAEGLTEADVWSGDEIKDIKAILPSEKSTQVPGMKEAVVYGDPYKLAEILDYQQGFDNPYGAFGTCAHTSISNLCKISGQNVTEPQVVEYAMENNLCIKDDNPIANGGATIKNQIEILKHYGIDAHCEFKDIADCERLALAIEGGHGVIVGLNSGVLQGRDWKIGGDGEKIKATHSVCLTGTVRDPENNELLGFYMCDSSSQRSDGAKIYVSVREMEDCYIKASDGFAVITDDPIRSSNKERFDSQGLMERYYISEEQGEIFKEFLEKKPKENVEKLPESNLLKMYIELGEARRKFEDAESDFDNSVYTEHKLFGIPIFKQGANCYAFGNDMEKNPITGEKFITNPYPGEISGHNWSNHDQYIFEYGSLDEIKDLMTTKWEMDCEAMGKELIEVDTADYKLKPGERLVSMSYTRAHCDDPQKLPDYHFMARQNTDFFLHKPGISAVTCKDDEGKLITDPAKCATKYENHLGYFVIRDKK